MTTDHTGNTHTHNTKNTNTHSPENTETWFQVHTVTEHAFVEQVQETLETAGALAITLSETDETDALWEPAPNTNPLWQKTGVTGLFNAEQMADESARTQLTKRLNALPLLSLRWEILADRVWEREWMKHFKPLCIANRLLIQPTLNEADTASIADTTIMDHKPVVLHLDPGLAFGTGSHPTTQLCLNWLCQQDLTGKTVVDYGCGSGILAIAALLLGAETVIAIDIDKQALQATLDNACKNHVQDHVTIGSPELLHGQHKHCDVLIANILAQPLLSLRQHFTELLKPQGIWAVSGLLVDQASIIENAYQASLQPTLQTQQDDWALIAGFLPTHGTE